MIILIKVIFLFLLADLVTGMFHFFVDQYGVMNGKVMTNSINLLLYHHKFPQKMLSQSYWEITGHVYKISIIVFVGSLYFGFYWELLLFLLFCSNSNMIHKWSHQKYSDLSPIVQYLQKYKIIQSKKHHNKHHNGYFNSNYCIMTNFLNPILHYIFFWKVIIHFLKLFRIHPSNISEKQK